MSRGLPRCWPTLVALGTAVVLLTMSGVLEVSLSFQAPRWLPQQQGPHHGRAAMRQLQAMEVEVLPGTDQHSQQDHHHHAHQNRSLKYSIYTGTGRTAQDLAEVHEHANSRQLERALERVRAIERGAGTQALQNVLAEYKARHEACTDSTGMPGKYVVMSMRDEYAGLGNQFPSIITGFLLAVLTERCFFVDFNFYDLNFAPEVDLSWARHSQRLLALGHNVNDSANAPLEIPVWKGEDVSGWLLQDQKALYERHYGIMLKEDPDYSAALFQANPHHQDYLKQLFPTGEMFQPLARFLLKVKPELEAMVQDFKRRHFRPVTIGIQIRRLKCDGEVGSINCDELPAVENYVAVARTLQHARGLDDSEVRFFVGADEPETYQKVMQLLGPDLAIYRRDNGVGVVSSEVIGVHNPSTPESALVDMRLLAECTDLVITVASSYGSVAAGWGGIAPVQMLHGAHKNVQNPYWYRQISSEPCYWKGQIFLNNEDPFWGTLGERERAQFKSNPFWMQYIQCHCST